MRIAIPFALAVLLTVPLLAAASADVGTAKVGPIEVRTEVTEKYERPQAVVVFPVRLTNTAPHALRITFHPDPVEGDWKVATPNPLVISARGEGTAVLDVPFFVQTPHENGYNTHETIVTLRIRAQAADGTGETFEGTLTFRVHARGFYVPSPAPILALIVAVLPAVARRRA